MEAETRGLVVVRTTDVAQLRLRCLLEPFDPKPVEVRNHRKHSSMDLLQTKKKGDVPAEALALEQAKILFFGCRWNAGEFEIIAHVTRLAHANQCHRDSRR